MRPTVIQDYNSGMGGTDLHDQLLITYYSTVVQCRRWPIRLITYFLMSSVTNAFILCKYKGGLTGRDSISLFEFIDLLMDDIEEIPREEDSD
jgi:hypothetical protein